MSNFAMKITSVFVFSKWSIYLLQYWNEIHIFLYTSCLLDGKNINEKFKTINKQMKEKQEKVWEKKD